MVSNTYMLLGGLAVMIGTLPMDSAGTQATFQGISLREVAAILKDELPKDEEVVPKGLSRSSSGDKLFVFYGIWDEPHLLPRLLVVSTSGTFTRSLPSVRTWMDDEGAPVAWYAIDTRELVTVSGVVELENAGIKDNVFEKYSLDVSPGGEVLLIVDKDSLTSTLRYTNAPIEILVSMDDWKGSKVYTDEHNIYVFGYAGRSKYTFPVADLMLRIYQKTPGGLEKAREISIAEKIATCTRHNQFYVQDFRPGDLAVVLRDSSYEGLLHFLTRWVMLDLDNNECTRLGIPTAYGFFLDSTILNE